MYHFHLQKAFFDKKMTFRTKSRKPYPKTTPVPLSVADGVCTVFCLGRLTGRGLKADCCIYYNVCKSFCKQLMQQNKFVFLCKFCRVRTHASLLSFRTYYLQRHPKQIFLKGGGQIMRVSSFVSGIATGAVAGAVVSMVAAGAMLNPSVKRSAQHAANKAEHAMHKAARSVGNMIG